MTLNFTETDWPKPMRDMAEATGAKLVRCSSVNGWLQVFVTVEAGLIHLSVSHPRRYPTWDEIKGIRYAMLPNNLTFALLLPPLSQYVNVHPNCFHLHEVPELHQP